MRDAEIAERLLDLCAFKFRQIDGSHGVFCLAERWKTCSRSCYHFELEARF
jgi:hypothetical protein